MRSQVLAQDVRLARARLSLDGLSLGDAFGERYFGRDEFVVPLIEQRLLMEPPWTWTDDTVMALSVVEVLSEFGRIDSDALAAAFARRYADDPRRGYGGTAHAILRDIGAGKPWVQVSHDAFDGSGSKGNGAAMRVAPIGAYFADDLPRVVDEARMSAEPTHAHPDGQAGAIAVAVAAAFAATRGPAADGRSMLLTVLDHTPDGETRDGLARALQLRDRGMSTRSAAEILGSGRGVISSDTVPFSLFCA